MFQPMYHSQGECLSRRLGTDEVNAYRRSSSPRVVCRWPSELRLPVIGGLCPSQQGRVTGCAGETPRFEKDLDPQRRMTPTPDCSDANAPPITRTPSNLFGESTARATFWFRSGVVGMFALLAFSTVALSHRNLELERRLTDGEARVTDISSLLERTERRAITQEHLGTVQAGLESDLSSTVRRVAALEARSQAVTRTIAAVSPSVVFLQGAYGFVEEGSGRPLRYVLGANGKPIATPRGPAVSLNGTGPVIEAQFTGTAFVTTSDGLLLTNRHVAVPWEDDKSVEAFSSKGLVPVIRRFVGYLPDIEEPFDVTLVSVSDESDLAVLKGGSIPSEVPALELSTVRPQPGDEVIVVGYPTGFRALLARTEKRFLDDLGAEGELDAWTVAEQLSKTGSISPLATRGIIGQVTETMVVYDAETAQGGSGGPVLTADGKVVAINTAILPEFGGSNLGVPVARALPLLARDQLPAGMEQVTRRELTGRVTQDSLVGVANAKIRQRPGRGPTASTEEIRSEH